MKLPTSTPLLAAALVTSLGSVACDRPSDSMRSPDTTTPAPTHATVDDVKDTPARFYGKKVTLSGEVAALASDQRAFTLEGSEWIFPDKIRVLTRSPVKMGGAPLASDDHVLVTGTVRRFVKADIDRELGWNLTPETEVTLRDKPVLVADEIRRVEPSATWTAQKPEGEIVSVVTMVTTFSPEALAGQPITLEHTKVQTVTGKVVWVGNSHANQTPVVPPQGTEASSFKAGQTVDVRGTVRKTPPADEAVKTWGLPKELHAVLDREPLYVEASSIVAGKATDAKEPTSTTHTTSGKTPSGAETGKDAPRPSPSH